VDAGNNRAQEFSPTGQPLHVFGGPGALPGQLNDPTHIAVDSQGRAYVADSGNNRVQRFVRN
jgi:DNA-binding beta-propeller fold protein YncE